MNNKWLAAVAAVGALALIVDGCGGGGGAGGGNLNTQIGGAIDSPCTPQYHNEGCSTQGNKRLRVKCTPDAADATKGAWKLLAECAEGKEFCDATKKDPTDASGAKVLSECKPLGNSSSGGTSSGGTSSGGTSSGGTSSGGTSSGGTSSGGTSSGGTSRVGGPTVAEQVKCAQEKCPAEWGKCAADTTCGPAVQCALNCKPNDQTCQQGCLKDANEQTLQVLLALQGCAVKAECIPACGDGKCNLGETAETCAADCKGNTGPKCGDGKCDDGENVESCPQDCKTTGPKCGDGKCDEGENAETCAQDCKTTVPKCGNGKCDEGETPDTCAQDCKTTGMPKDCGNLQCKSPETAKTCSLDCNPEVTKVLVCGVEACPSQWNACKASSKCLEVLNCAGACNQDDSSCATACLSKADSGSQQAMMAFGQCAESKCGNTQPECSASKPCGSGKKCVDGKCVTDGGGTTCTSDMQCSSGQKCVEGKCMPDGGTSGTCKDKKCEYASGAACQCDSECEKYKDCCPDKAQYCPAAP